jgi:hypothetical protein
VTNNILLSMLWNFVSIWVGIKKGINNIQRFLFNYIWIGSFHNYYYKVAWSQSCEKKNVGLGLVNLVEVMCVIN